MNIGRQEGLQAGNTRALNAEILPSLGKIAQFDMINRKYKENRKGKVKETVRITNARKAEEMERIKVK